MAAEIDIREFVRHMIIGIGLASILLFQIEIAAEMGLIDESLEFIGMTAGYGFALYSMLPMLEFLWDTSAAKIGSMYAARSE